MPPTLAAQARRRFRQFPALLRRGISHPSWLVEQGRMVRERRAERSRATTFALDVYSEFLVEMSRAVAEVTGRNEQDFHDARAQLWRPREPGGRIKTWDARDVVIDVVGTVVVLTEPESVVETGVARGYTTATILSAMRSAGRGHLYSVDLPPLEVDPKTFVGSVIPEELKDRWTLTVGPSRSVLEGVAEQAAPIDVFLHDADHTYEAQLEEYRTVWPRLRSEGYLLSDDVGNPAFVEFAEEVGSRPYLVPRHGKTAFGLLRKH